VRSVRSDTGERWWLSLLTRPIFFSLVMSTPSLTGPTRPTHDAAYNGDLDEIARLLVLGEPVDSRNEVNLSRSSLSSLI
jgi:hypothetical protein